MGTTKGTTPQKLVWVDHSTLTHIYATMISSFEFAPSYSKKMEPYVHHGLFSPVVRPFVCTDCNKCTVPIDARGVCAVH